MKILEIFFAALGIAVYVVGMAIMFIAVVLIFGLPGFIGWLLLLWFLDLEDKANRNKKKIEQLEREKSLAYR